MAGSGEQRAGLGCDSLEQLWLASAANEMFHLYEAGGEQSLLSLDTFGAWADVVAGALAAGTQGVTFSTSGSTAAPKRCAHRWADLELEMDALAGMFADRTRIVALAPAHHIYGFLFTAMLPSRLRVPVLDATALSAGELGRTLAPGDLVVTFPERWLYVERSLPSFPAGVIGTTSTAPCPAWLPAALAAKGLGALVEIYGSSETAGIGTRRWPEPAYSLMPHWRRMPGVAPGEAERLMSVTGVSVEAKDRLVFGTERTFVVDARIDGAVQVGGVNVVPEQVAERLRVHPAVREARVRLMRPEEGSRLKAFVVPAPEHEGFAEADLLSWIDGAFPVAAERPRQVTFGSALPVGPLGKPADW